MKLFLMRHGESQGNTRGLIYGKSDWPLTEKGRLQAERCARSLEGLGIRRIVSSSLGRARQSAQIAGGILGLTPEADVGLDEQDMGRWENLTLAEAEGQDPAALAAMLADWTKNAPPGGESFEALRRRVRRSLEAIVSDGRDTLIVAHGGTLTAVLTLLLTLPDSCAARFEFEHDRTTLIEAGSGDARLLWLNR